MLPSQSPSLTTLLAATHPDELNLRILIVDNTPGGQDPGPLPPHVLYQAAPTNPGLAEAYNHATAQAAAQGYPWLLTLDQDTHLPANFLSVLAATLARHAGDARIGAIVGHISDAGRPLSPLHFARGFWPRVLPAAFAGLAPPFTTALNSASLLRVEALQAIGGYDPRFPLNNSDTSLFHRLAESGRRLFVPPQLAIEHQLAIMDRADRMTPERYRQLLTDERAFWDLHMGPAARAERLFKLSGRFAKDLLTGANAPTRTMTLNEIRLRLLTRHRHRLESLRQAQPHRSRQGTE